MTVIVRKQRAKEKIRAALLLIGVISIVVGCGYSVGPESSIVGQTEWRSIDFEKFKVEPRGYPRFQAKQSILPPNFQLSIPMAEITVKDLWEVRYRLNDYYLIFSETYNNRQCHLLLEKRKSMGIVHQSPFTGKCSSRYLYCIVVDLKGNVTKGLELVHNPDVLGSVSARQQSFKPLDREMGDWGIQPLFEVVN